MQRARAVIAILTLWLPPLVAAPARGEVVEEIIAWVNGEIITRSEYEEELRGQIGEVYRRFSGEELDRAVQEVHDQLLLQMIDRKILVHHARALGYDTDKMGDQMYESFKDSFMKQQNVESDEEFERLLARDGMTIAELKRSLIETNTPEEVKRFEVRSRIAVGDRELEAYYAQHPDEFSQHGKVTFREIVLRADTPAARDGRRAEAADLLARLQAGADFAELAGTVSEAGTRDSEGLLGPLTREDLRAELADVAFTIPVGQVSDWIEMPYGFHLIRVESRVEEQMRPLDEIRQQLRSFLEERKYRAELAEFMKKARAESEWCVKASYRDQLPIDAPTSCETL